MQQHQSIAHKQYNNKHYKYDDWVCLFCQNYNYSFRAICNRCHLQTRQQNNYILNYYAENSSAEHSQQDNCLEQANNDGLQFFPNVLFFMINNDPWEQQPQRKEMPQTINVKWINTLIED